MFGSMEENRFMEITLMTIHGMMTINQDYGPNINPVLITTCIFIHLNKSCETWSSCQEVNL